MKTMANVVGAILLFWVGQVVLLSVGFVFGIDCSSVYFWGMLIACSCLSFAQSRKTGIVFTIICALGFLLAAFTYTYIGTDAQTCHAPLQRLVVEGWNPVWQGSVADVERQLAQRFGDNHGFYALHMIFAPKFTAYAGATAAAGTGLWLADSFLGWMLAFVLLFVSYRFSCMVFNTSALAGMFFSVAIASSSTIIWMMSGFVDFTIYAAMIIVAFECVCWCHEGNAVDLATFGLAFVVCLSSKATGIAFGLLAIIFAMILSHGGNKKFWIVVSSATVLALVINVSPILAMIEGASSMDALTSDFGGNADAESMGYFARICYAWFSKKAAIAGCAWLNGNPDFNPAFAANCGGRSAVWSAIFLISIVALVLSRFNAVTLNCLLLFISANAVPLKYIGYSRYCPQIGIFPILGLFNLIYNPRPMFKIVAQFRFVVFLVMAVYVVPSFADIPIWFGCQMALEKVRQCQMQEMARKERTWKSEKIGGVWHARFRMTGITLSHSCDNAPCVRYDSMAKVFFSQDCKFVETAGPHDFWLYGGVSGFVNQFAWRRWLMVFLRPPHVLWSET